MSIRSRICLFLLGTVPVFDWLRKRGPTPIVRSTLRAVPAIGVGPLFRNLLFAGQCLIHVTLIAPTRGDDLSASLTRAAATAKTVTIHRDNWGVPHIYAPTDVNVAFGMAYAQCEDFFWQIEDTYIRSLGRYSEVAGPSALGDDLLNRTFEIVKNAQADWEKLEQKYKDISIAYTDGVNYFLSKNPEVKPRLITKFEPWHDGRLRPLHHA